MGNLTTSKTWYYVIFMLFTSLALNVSCSDDDGDPAGNAGSTPPNHGEIILTPPKKSNSPIQVVWNAETEKLLVFGEIGLTQAELQSEGQSVCTTTLNPELLEQFLNFNLNGFSGEYVLILSDTKGEKNYIPLIIGWKL